MPLPNSFISISKTVIFLEKLAASKPVTFLKLESTIDTSVSSKVMYIIFANCIFDMFNSLDVFSVQDTNNLFGGCISVWEKEDEE